MLPSSSRNLLESDFAYILDKTADVFAELDGARLFVTGGSGFFGRWLLGSLLYASDRIGLKLECVLLTRDSARFTSIAPDIVKHRSVKLWQGDICDFEYPGGRFSDVLHLAAETNSQQTDPPPSRYFNSSVDGTRRVLDLAVRSGASRFLFTSSGAVYGTPPDGCEAIPEVFEGAPSPERIEAAYGHGKRASEFLCASASYEYGIDTKIARCFAFVGPLLPMSSGYAIGNFIRDAVDGVDIKLSSDGSSLRSYLYAADLAWWLWTILLNGASARPYNVGADRSVSILELARTVAGIVDSRVRVEVGTPSNHESLRKVYVPDVSRAQDELGLVAGVTLEDAISRTASWYLTSRTQPRSK